MPPPSQKQASIAFAGSGGFYQFIIRPEELTRFEPSRLAVQQTLGGAWIDAFDRGIITIKINGTTGWRGASPLGTGGATTTSGEAQFQLLRQNSFISWHAQRAAIVAGGGDPNDVTLMFVDTLNGFTDYVAPKSFTLRRSKTRPLLLMYSIEMLVLGEVATTPIAAAVAAPNIATAGTLLNGLANAIDGLAGALLG